MPRFHLSTVQHPQIALWKIEEELPFFERLFSAPEIQNVSRKLQWYATRQLANELTGKPVEILKDEFGKPSIRDDSREISITHTQGYAAVMLGNGHTVGIDLEAVNAKVERIAHKFLYEDEIEAIGQAERIEKLILYWSAKESLYKLHGRKLLEFKTQLLIEPFVLHRQGALKAKIIANDISPAPLKIQYCFFGDHVLTYVEGR